MQQPNREHKRRKLETTEDSDDDDRKMPAIQRRSLEQSLAQRMSDSLGGEHLLAATHHRTQRPTAPDSSFGRSDQSYYPEGQLGDEMRELERRFLVDEDEAKTSGGGEHGRSSLPHLRERERLLSLSTVQRSLLSPAHLLASARLPDLRADHQLMRGEAQRLERSPVDDIDLLRRKRDRLNSILGASVAGLHSSTRDVYPQQASLQLPYHPQQRPPPFASRHPPLPQGFSYFSSSKKETGDDTDDTICNNGKGYVVPVAAKTDRCALTTYQTLVRESLEYFTAVEEDVNTKVQGRRQKIKPNQVGIRCKYCSHLPFACRGRAAVYFPKTLSSLYQGAQNIATVHFLECTEFPSELLQRIQLERGRRGMDKAGRPYWSSMCRDVGVYEADNLLRMIPPSETVAKGP